MMHELMPAVLSIGIFGATLSILYSAGIWELIQSPAAGIPRIEILMMISWNSSHGGAAQEAS